MITLRKYIEDAGYTVKEWDDCVDELCKNGVGKGCYQDYNFLIKVLGWFCNYDCQEG